MARGGARFTAGGPRWRAGFEDLLGGLFGGAPAVPAVGGMSASPRSRRSRAEPGGPPRDVRPERPAPRAGGPGRLRRSRGRGRTSPPRRRCTFRQALEGALLNLRVEDSVSDGRTVTARIPAGVRDGQKIRLRGKGQPGAAGGEPGDLVVTVHVQPHPVFAIDGNDLRVTVPVTFPRRRSAPTIEVPTPDGGTVRLRVPAGTPSRPDPAGQGRGACRAPADRATCSSPSRWPCRSGWTATPARRSRRSVPRPRARTRARTCWPASSATTRGPAMADEASYRIDVGFTVDETTPVFVISVAAQLAGMHPQTLRQYDRLGLVTPGRTAGRGRRYSPRDVALLREVQRLSQDEGVNLAGIKRILELEAENDAAARRARPAARRGRGAAVTPLLGPPRLRGRPRRATSWPSPPAGGRTAWVRRPAPSSCGDRRAIADPQPAAAALLTILLVTGRATATKHVTEWSPRFQLSCWG